MVLNVLLELLTLLRTVILLGGAAFLIENANRAVLANSVGDFGGIDPHGELGWEETVEDCGHEADIGAGLSDHRVHFAIDPDAAVARASIWPVGEPMVPVSPLENLCQRRLEQLELPLRHLARLHAQQIHEKVCC